MADRAEDVPGRSGDEGAVLTTMCRDFRQLDLPTRIVQEAVEEFSVDGIDMIFQNTPGTEAPSEMNTYIPSMKALWMAENLVGSVHNIYTLRGAQVRDSLR